MEPPAKRQRLSLAVERQRFHESSSDDDEFYAPALPKEQPKDHPKYTEETDVDDEVEILDEGEEVEEIDEADLHIRRTQSLNKVRSKWDEICEKYGRDFENADEIDLNTLEVVVDKGHIAQMKDENDVGNGQPTPRQEKLRAQRVVNSVLAGPRQEDQRGDTGRRANDEQPQMHRHTSPTESRLQHKPDLKRNLGTSKHVAKEVIYEDESSDDDFLYEKPEPTTVVLAPRQPQAINQIRPRGGSRTVVEKRTVITTRRITTSTIRDGRSDGIRDQNGRQRSHERRSREVQQYTKSSQEKIVETSSDDELVQRDQEPVQVERPPSPKGKVSLWAPRMKAGRPRLAYDERGTPQRHVSRRDRTPRYDANGQKIRKQRSDRGKMRKPEHLRKTKFVNRYAHLQQDSTSSMAGDSSPSSRQRPHLLSDWTDSSMPIPTSKSEETPQPIPAKPVVFARNTVDKSYDFSDEEDDALPQRPLPSLLTVPSNDAFLGQDPTVQPIETFLPRHDDNYLWQHDQKLDTTTLEPPHSPPPPYSEFVYQPSPLSAYNSNIEHTDFDALMAPTAHMETLHQFLPFEGDTSGCMDQYLSFPEMSPQEQHQHHHQGEMESTKAMPESTKLESEDDLSIPIDPALLALDAENRAASLERAEAAAGQTDEPDMEGTSVLTLPCEELVGYKNSLQPDREKDESDDENDLFEPRAPAIRSLFEQKESVEQEVAVDDNPADSVTIVHHDEEPVVVEKTPSSNDVVGTNPIDDLVNSTSHMEPPQLSALLAETSHLRNAPRIEVPDSDVDSEDELLTQPSSQPPPRAMNSSSQSSSVQVTPITKEAMKRVRFAQGLVQEERSRSKALLPSPMSILRDHDRSKALPPSSPASAPQLASDPVDAAPEEEDDEDDLALVPSTPAAKPKPQTEWTSTVASNPPSAKPDPPLSTSRAPSIQPSDISMDRPRRNELASSKPILNRPSLSRSVTPQPASSSRSKSTPVSRASSPRLFSLSVSPQPAQRPKLRASLLSEAASTTPGRRAQTATPPPQPQAGGVRRRGAAGRLLSASPSLGADLSGTKRPRDWS